MPGWILIQPNAVASGTINSIGYINYTYNNIQFDGSIANGAYTANANIHDPNIDMNLIANGVFNGQYPSLRFTADIDSIKTQPLQLTSQSVIYHGKMEGNFTNLDPDNLKGDLFITNSVLVNPMASEPSWIQYNYLQIIQTALNPFTKPFFMFAETKALQVYTTG